MNSAMNFNLGDILTKRPTARRQNEEGVALVFEDERLTYGELDQLTRRLATGLSQAGFQRGDTVAVISHNRSEWFPIFFAVARLGGVLAPINFLLAPSEIEYILDDSGTGWVFCEDRFWDKMSTDRLAGSRRYMSLGERCGEDAYEDFVAEEDGEHGDLVDGSSLFTLLYTSGTTGLPKGAMHTHSTVLWNTFLQIADFNITAADTHFVVPSLCWGAGFHDLTLPTLWAGGKVVLKQSMGFDPDQFCEAVERERITKTLLVPSALRQVTDSENLDSHDLSSLRSILCGGESVPADVIEVAHSKLPNARVSQVYGLSEFPSLMLILGPNDALERVGSTGLASFGATVRVVDEEQEDVAPREVGEIICRSPAVMVGYLGNEEATKTTLRDGWLRTGDLARLDEDGYVHMVGRAKDMYISGGLNVYPAEVERVLERCEGVAEAAVIGVPSERFGESGHAIVVAAAGCELNDEVLLGEIEARLAKYKLPRSFEIRSEPLPRTTSGKVQKRLLASDQAL
jgi:fatty-acyl-CoA synthase